jgi:hypothetical protein
MQRILPVIASFLGQPDTSLVVDTAASERSGDSGRIQKNTILDMASDMDNQFGAALISNLSCSEMTR